jgi:hypothetical protein
MGVTTNSLRPSHQQGPLQLLKKPDAMTKLSSHASENLMKGSITTPIIAECMDISFGILNRDFQKATFNGALISLPFLTASLGSKITMNTATSGAMMTAAALSSVSQSMTNSNSRSTQVTERNQN